MEFTKDQRGFHNKKKKGGEDNKTLTLYFPLHYLYHHIK